MKKLLITLAILFSFAANVHAAALIGAAFGNISGVGGALNAGKQATNTLYVNGVTLSKVGGKPTLTIPTGVTAVTGTSPVISSGGTTPVISMPAATNSVSGYMTAADHATLTTFVNADASSGAGGTGIDGGTIGTTVTYSGSGQLTVIKTDSTAFVVAIFPPVGKLICGRSEYDLSIGGESASFYPDQNGNLNRVW